jgi:tRNA pseudouridine55 synthase
LAEYLSAGDKSYYCEMTAGYETDSQDIWGNTMWSAPEGSAGLPGDPDRLAGAVSFFVGEIQQEVPAYSAVKREGKSLHQYAREGMLYTGITRNITIRSIEILKVGPDKLGFVVECGSGTYVRMLCRDLGRKLGCGGVMSFLLRLKVGQFLLENSVTLEEIRIRKEFRGCFDDIIAPKESALAGMTRIIADSKQAERIRHGQPVWLTADCSWDEDKVWASDDRLHLVALGHASTGEGGRNGQILFKPDKVFAE